MATALEVSSVPITFKTLGGGLNSTSGPLGVADNESSELNNIEFDKFGSIQPRKGYYPLNISAVSNSGTAHGLYWYRSLSDEYAIMVNNGKIYKMDDLDGQWDDITGTVSFSSGGVDSDTTLMLHCDGDNGASTFTDSSNYARTITNTESHDSYTVLMLHCDGTDGSTTFTDSSLGTHTCTAVGNVQIDTSDYKFYSGSGLFNGVADYITVPDNAAWDFAGGNWTIDFWVKYNNLGLGGLFHHRTDNDHFHSLSFTAVGGGTYTVYSSGSVVTVNISNGSITAGNWYHVALVHSSTTYTAYVNGEDKGSTTDVDVPENYTGNFEIGRRIDQLGNEIYFDGWIDEFRVSKGIARFIGNFTPPAGTHGVVSTSIDTKKFGTAGGYFAGSYPNSNCRFISAADSNDFFFSNTNFTVDFWVRLNSVTNAMNFMGQYEDGSNFWFLRKDNNANSNKLQLRFVDGNSTKSDYTMTNAWSVSTGTWYHLAFIRNSIDALVFIDGNSQALTSGTAFGTNDVGNMASVLTIGQVGAGSFVDGFMDEIRISKNIARWTSNFTPPNAAYNDSVGGQGVQDFDTFLGYVLAAGEGTTPWQWYAGNSTATSMTVVTNLTEAKFVRKFQNYCFLGNVKISGVRYPSRVYWSAIRSITSWDAADWIEISKDDGDEITGLKVLGDRLVVYKTNSIYIIIFTADPDIPFVVQKSNSAVGCIAPYSIQEAENGHIFVSQDGIYFFDGYNSYKLSDRISDTFEGMNKDRLEYAVSMYQKRKNRYWVSLSSGTSLYNNFILSWNSFLNSWTKYTGFSASAMVIFTINNTEERPYFGDYLGYSYRTDYGLDDYPSNSKTAINPEYYTNWKSYDSVCDNKGIPNLYIVHNNESSANLNFSYSYDFYNGNQYSSTISLFTTQTVTALTTRRDLTGRGKFVRFRFGTTQTSTTFRIDGIGTYVTRESKS